MNFIDPNGMNDEPILDKDNDLIGYKVEEGQTAEDVVEDINTRAENGEFELESEVTVEDIEDSRTMDPETKEWSNVDDAADLEEGDLVRLDPVVKKRKTAHGKINDKKIAAEVKKNSDRREQQKKIAKQERTQQQIETAVYGVLDVIFFIVAPGHMNSPCNNGSPGMIGPMGSFNPNAVH